MMQIKTFCCRFGLKTGSLVIGIISAVCALAALVGWLTWAHLWVNRWYEDGQHWAQSARAMGFTEEFVGAQLRDRYSTLSFVTGSTRVLFHLLGVVEAFYFNFSLILLFGIWKKRPSLMQLWVRVSVVAMALRLLLLLPIVVQMLKADYVTFGVITLALITCAIALAAYFILIVHNYQTELESEKRQKQFTMTWTDLR